MQISGILVLFALSAIAEAQWAAAARNLYQPVILSVGTAFAFMNGKVNTDGLTVGGWMADKFTFSNEEVKKYPEDSTWDPRSVEGPPRRPTEAMQDTSGPEKIISNKEYEK